MTGRLSSLFLLLGASAISIAHPMGNFSVSHHARIVAGIRSMRVFYSLDLAEIPTFELTAGTNSEDVVRLAETAMPRWASALRMTVNGKPVSARLGTVRAVKADGAGGMPVVRVTAELTADVATSPAIFEFADPNFAGRAGWKEIVVEADAGTTLVSSTHGATDLSRALTEYPTDASIAPPQHLNARVEWSWAVATTSRVLPSTPSTTEAPQPSEQHSASLPQPSQAPAPAQAAGGPAQTAPGSVVRGDFLSTLLSRKELPLAIALMGLGAAFVMGAIHAASPGHGKTIVAAYLVGSRGTMRHAMFLGAIVTFTHTVSVFLLGLATLFLSQYILPETIVPWMGAISGLSIVLIGFTLFRRRLMKLLGRESTNQPHRHGDFEHSHDHVDAGHDHGDGRHHHHVPEGEVTLASLVALGVSGGLVPCPSALVLLLSAIAIGRTAYGMLLLVAFSLGLSIVLMAIGALVLYAKKLIPSASRFTASPAYRLVPVLSAALIIGVGVLMTGASIGIIKPIGG